MCCDDLVFGEPSWLASLCSLKLARRPSTLPLPFLWANLTPLRPFPILKNGRGRKGGGLSLGAASGALMGAAGVGGVLRSRAALRKVWWRRRDVRQLLSRRPCLGGGLYFAQELEGPGSRAGMSSACSSSCGPVAAVQKGRAGAMLKSEGGRCGAAGVVARMEWSFTCTSAGQHSSWLLGGRWSLQIAPSATSVRQRSSGPVLPWRGLWRPGTPEASKKSGSFWRGLACLVLAPSEHPQSRCSIDRAWSGSWLELPASHLPIRLHWACCR
jgi:hypothetical protein